MDEITVTVCEVQTNLDSGIYTIQQLSEALAKLVMRVLQVPFDELKEPTKRSSL
jgi:hypothetical protein